MEINSLLNNQWVKEEIKREMRKYIEMIENEDTTYQKLNGMQLKKCLEGNYSCEHLY